MKKYEHRFIPVPPAPPTPPPMNQKIDSLGQKYVPRSEPLLWKLSYTLIHVYKIDKKKKKKNHFILDMIKLCSYSIHYETFFLNLNLHMSFFKLSIQQFMVWCT
jgi:hypothetical protein